MKRMLAVLPIGLVLGAGSALAAQKALTLNGPANYTAGGWVVHIQANAPLGTTATSWTATTQTCAYDSSLGVNADCKDVVETSSTPPAVITDFVNQRLANWRAVQGY